MSRLRVIINAQSYCSVRLQIIWSSAPIDPRNDLSLFKHFENSRCTWYQSKISIISTRNYTNSLHRCDDMVEKHFLITPPTDIMWYYFIIWVAPDLTRHYDSSPVGFGFLFRAPGPKKSFFTFGGTRDHELKILSQDYELSNIKCC